jgi:prepilin-type N-terminal cleavage/methylation domain-containing protein
MFEQLREREEGFTLIELLIAITIMGVVISGLATAFVTTLRGTKDLHNRFIESQDAQLLATYFPSDVQSANPTMIDTSASPADECNGVTGANIVRMRWTQSDGATLTAFSASYRLTTTADGGVLTRWFCTGTGSATGPGTDADKAAAILKTLTATSKVVARNLATTAPTVTVGANTVDMTLASFKTGYTFKFSGTTRTPGTWLTFIVGAPSPATATAGADVTFPLTAKNAAGATDTSFDGTKTITVGGFLASPNGTTPLSTVTGSFTAGVGSVTIKLYKAAPTTLSFTQGVYRGTMTSPVNVNAGPYTPGNLSFSACPPNTKVGQTTTLQVLRTMADAYGNATSTAPAATVNLAQTGGASLAPASVSFAANGGTSGSFTVTNPATPGTTVTLTASSTGYGSDTCSYKTSNNPKFLVTKSTSPVAGSSFTITVTATTDGTTTDTSYSGSKTLTFSGPGNAPNGTAPAYPATAAFTAGVATVPITLYKAETGVTMTVSDGTQSGTLLVDVAAGSMSLQFSVCPATLKKNTSLTSTMLRQDAWGNASGSDTIVAVSASAGDFGGKSKPTSTSVTVPAGSAESPSFTYNAPNSNGTTVTLTASASGFTNVACTFTTN